MQTLNGKVALVTGASSGIGLEAAIQLAERGAEVVMVAREGAKGDTALAEARRRSGSQSLSLVRCDFASQAQIRALAAAFRAAHSRLDILVNNAGSVSDKRVVTPDGLEQTFAVNHLGYFLLTNLLLEVLQASAPSRVVNVASVGHRQGDLPFDNLQFENGGYGIMKAYGRSKLGNVLFTRELARRLAGKGVLVNCLHPGAVATDIWSHAPWYARPALSVAKLFMVTPVEGGARIVHLAVDDLAGATGGYYERNQRVSPSKLAQDDAAASQLWDVSAKLVALA